jgi:hypothetical protein
MEYEKNHDGMVEWVFLWEGFKIFKTHMHFRKLWLTYGKVTKKLYSQIMEA